MNPRHLYIFGVCVPVRDDESESPIANFGEFPIPIEIQQISHLGR